MDSEPGNEITPWHACVDFLVSLSPLINGLLMGSNLHFILPPVARSNLVFRLYVAFYALNKIYFGTIADFIADNTKIICKVGVSDFA